MSGQRVQDFAAEFGIKAEELVDRINALGLEFQVKGLQDKLSPSQAQVIRRALTNPNSHDLYRNAINTTDRMRLQLQNTRLNSNPTTQETQMGQDDANTNNRWETVVGLETARFELLKQIEKARLELQQEYAAGRMTLLKENHEQIEWMMEALGDLRKERMKFQKKSLPEIAEALKDSNVPDDLVNEWLAGIADMYHQDLSLAQRMISADVEQVDECLFSELKADFDKRLRKVIDEETERAYNKANAIKVQEPTST